MSGERCPSCPPDALGNWPCAAPRCPRSVDGRDLIVPIPAPAMFERAHQPWIEMGAPIRVRKYVRVCTGGIWYWREKS